MRIGALKIALIYVFLGALWILASDELIGILSSDSLTLTRLQTIKGWVFKLPKVAGLGVLRRVKSDERIRATPVAVLTSSREERDVVVESYKPGVDSYIVKPVDFDQFI